VPWLSGGTAAQVDRDDDRGTAVRILVTLTAALVLAGTAAAGTTKDVPAFEYRFQVTSVTEKSTFTKGDASAVTMLHLASLPKAKSLDWYGKTNHLPFNGEAAALIHLTGTITYTGLTPDSCNGTVAVDSARWARATYAALSVTNARDSVVTHPTISAGAGGFPFGTVYPRRNGKCESGATNFFLNDWPKPDSGPGDELPLAVVHQPTFSLANSYHERFDDGSSVQWSVAMTVRRIHYFLIDCSHTQQC
jgi:hypothetical protein